MLARGDDTERVRSDHPAEDGTRARWRDHAMARTPLAASLIEAASVASEATIREIPVERVIRERITRREFLRRGAVLGVAGATALTFGPVASVRAAAAPRIAVIGAGLAGLTCAYRLKQAGYAATIYEASDRIGGRCWTIRDVFDQGQIAEHGGELIDQGHTAIRQLARELGFTLDNLLAGQLSGTEDFFRFDGAPYSFADATDDLKGIWQQIHNDVSAASYPTLFDNYTPRGFELDHLSITDYINAYVPVSAKGYDVGPGMQSKLGQLLDVAYNIEYGGECSVQSSLNLLYLLAYSGQGQLRIFGPSNEKYHVKGGNDQIPLALASLLDGQIARGMELTAVAQNRDGSYSLSFRGQGKATIVDRVVLALPFSMLRSVDYSRANFGALKDTAIRNLPMGTNSKLHVQFSERHWNVLGNNGNTLADTGYQNTWEVTRAQPGRPGILVDYTGGTIGASFGSGTPDSRARQFLAQLEPVLPGITGKYLPGKATVDFWTAYPWTRGSYSFWKVGQYTGFSGVEKLRRGKVHFCGEHTSQDFQGYLNGGVETGERVAGEILGDFKAGILP
jgi:monoamine oxidase